MPQLAPIVLQDGASTPVSHTFSPKGITDGIVAHLEESVGVPAVRSSIVASARKPINGKGVYRMQLDVRVPSAQVVDGVTAAHHTNTVTITFLVNESSTNAEVNDLYAFARNLLANALIIDLVKTQSPFY